VKTGALGKVYHDGEVIVRQRDRGDCMYVIQEGAVEVFREEAGGEVPLAVLRERDFFGEVPLLERANRTATVRARGPVRVLTVDKKTFVRRMHEDPGLAYRLLQTLSRRVRELDDEVAALMAAMGELRPRAERRGGPRRSGAAGGGPHL
jgi:CRP-like cAMP-binding protein